MLLSLFLIAAITAGGLALTYLISDEDPLMFRIASGCVIGSAVFGTVGFVAASIVGLTPLSAAIVFIIALSPLLIFRNTKRRKSFAADRNRAKNLVQGESFRRLWPFAYYAFFFLLFLFFFERAMFIRDGAIMTGGSNNLGDLPFHLGAIFSFTEGNNFPPINPNFDGAKFSYPFIADLITAYFVKLGADVRDAMLVQNIAWAFSLLVILERFVFKLVKDKLTARIAPFLLFFSGGLGFVWFFSDWAAQSKGFFEFLFALPKDYTIGPDMRWGNSLITLFLTQRSLLLGMPITLIVLGFLWETFVTHGTEKSEKKIKSGWSWFLFPYFLVGILAGLLPLIHLHSLFVLFVVTAFLSALRRDQWATWLSFGIGVCLIAVPELVWSMSGSATRASEFVGRHFGWDSGETNLIWFWIKNTGMFIPLIAAGAYFVWKQLKLSEAVEPEPAIKGKKETKTKTSKAKETVPIKARSLLYFYIPFALLFVGSNLFKCAPWEWDNIKILIYWWVGSIPLVAYAIAALWRQSGVVKVFAGVFFAVLILSGSLDVFRTISKQVNYTVFDKDAVEIAEAIRTRTAPDSLVLSAPTYNTAVVLSGRRSVMRYPGHLSSHGIDYAGREDDVRKIYSGGPAADELLTKYGIDLVLFGPEITNFAKDRNRPFTLNEEHFKKYQVLTATAKYRIYKIK